MDQSSAAGLFVIDKPAGLTSHQVVAAVRRAMGTRKVGHAGTLDPMATGVLIIGVNRATRLLGHLALHDKSYAATIRLGQASSTDDAEGELTPVVDVSGLTAERIEQAIAPLRGEIDQVPSAVSAIKVNGQRAYALVRAGQQVELKARRVTVSRFEVLASRPAEGLLDLDVIVDCSSGTYVRALARDLGEALGVGGHLTVLRRLRIGHYDLTRAVGLEELDPAGMLTMAQAAELSFPVLVVSQAESTDIGHGRPVGRELAGLTGMIAPGGELLALYEPDAGTGRARPVCVLVGDGAH